MSSNCRICQETEAGAQIKEQGAVPSRGAADAGTAGAEDLRGDVSAEGAGPREEKREGGLSLGPTVLVHDSGVPLVFYRLSAVCSRWFYKLTKPMKRSRS